MLAACSSQPQDKTTKTAIKIGVIAPLTGQFESIAQPNLNGIKAAIDDINAAGGIQGSSVELIVKDTEGELEASLKAIETFYYCISISPHPPHFEHSPHFFV